MRNLASHRRSIIAMVIGATVLLLAAGTSARAAELLMLERQGCVWCARWNAEIAPAYPKSWEGRAAPLRRVDLGAPWPKDLQDIEPDFVTPTFILVSEGREVGRLRGYPGDNFFWPLLDELMARLPAAARPYIVD